MGRMNGLILLIGRCLMVFRLGLKRSVTSERRGVVSRPGYPQGGHLAWFLDFEAWTVYEGKLQGFLDWWNHHRPRGADPVRWAAEGDQLLLETLARDMEEVSCM